MNYSNGEDSHDVPAHEVREFLADVDGAEYVAYHSLEEAACDPQAAVVLSGDYGGTIFLTVPGKHVRCDLGALRTLVSDLDAVTWMSGDLTIATVALERHPIGTGVIGGDGGGVIVDGVWTHPSGLPQEIRSQAAAVVLGLRPRIDVDLRRERDRELARKKAWRLAHPAKIELAWDFDIYPPAVPMNSATGLGGGKWRRSPLHPISHLHRGSSELCSPRHVRAFAACWPGRPLWPSRALRHHSGRDR
jgi:hypothetical protein